MTNKRWQLLEYFELETDEKTQLMSEKFSPSQLFKAKSDKTENPVLIGAGLCPDRNLSQLISTILYRTIDKFVLLPEQPVYFSKFNLPKNYFSSKANAENITMVNKQLKTRTERWLSQINPRIVITYSTRDSLIRSVNAPQHMLEKLTEISERPHYDFENELSNLKSDNEMFTKHPETLVAKWCLDNNVTWIDFSMNSNIQTFNELKARDWKSCLGPALKHLVENNPFQIPEAEAPTPTHEYIQEPQGESIPDLIPSLELPQEFAHLQ